MHLKLFCIEVHLISWSVQSFPCCLLRWVRSRVTAIACPCIDSIDWFIVVVRYSQLAREMEKTGSALVPCRKKARLLRKSKNSRHLVLDTYSILGIIWKDVLSQSFRALVYVKAQVWPNVTFCSVFVQVLLHNKQLL